MPSAPPSREAPLAKRARKRRSTTTSARHLRDRIALDAMLSIGALARDAGVTPDTVRYYERQRLLAPTRRTASGYRLYDAHALRRLMFVKRAQQSGFSLGEIRDLLELRASENSCRRDVRAVAAAKRAQIASRIDALAALARALDRLIERCADDEGALDACPILAALEVDASATGARPSRRRRRA